MSKRTLAIAASCALLAGVLPAAATPDLRQPRTAGTLTVFPDDARGNLFFYPPGELALAVAENGQPQVHLLHARYTGSAATGDRGRIVIRSILSLRVRMAGPSAAAIAEARRSLAAALRRTVELRPLPIRRLESALVYSALEPTPTDAAASKPATDQPLPPGHFEAADETKPVGYWSERVYTLALSPADAQLLTAAMERGGLSLSIGYAFFADGIGPEKPLQELSGSPALVKELKTIVDTRAADDARAARPTTHVVRAGALAVAPDVARWPTIVQRVDINDSAPPGYAALDVYCYDFNQGSSGGLYEKQVEIDAEGVSRQRVRLTTTFSRAQPDLYARSLRFAVAVRLDRPYRYRVIEIAQDGTLKTGSWTERESWTELLDVTSQGGTL